MALEAITRIPDKLRAGDTLKVQQSLSDYPASTWTLTTEIVGASADLGQHAAVASGDDHVTTIAAGTTASWAAASYTWQQYVTSGTERRTVGWGTIEILANLATASTHDGRSHVKTTLDALEATIEGKASTDQLAYTIGDRSLSRMGAEELVVWYEKYKAWYAQEVREDRIAKGLGHSGKIRVRLGHPS